MCRGFRIERGGRSPLGEEVILLCGYRVECSGSPVRRKVRRRKEEQCLRWGKENRDKRSQGTAGQLVETEAARHCMNPPEWCREVLSASPPRRCCADLLRGGAGGALHASEPGLEPRIPMPSPPQNVLLFGLLLCMVGNNNGCGSIRS